MGRPRRNLSRHRFINVRQREGKAKCTLQMGRFKKEPCAGDPKTKAIIFCRLHMVGRGADR
jgi:hypothetical protein